MPFSPAGDLPNPGIEPTSLMSLASVDRFFTTIATWEAPFIDWSPLLTESPRFFKPSAFSLLLPLS